MKKYMAVMGAGMFGVVCFSLYLMMESVGFNRMDKQRYRSAINELEGKIQHIQSHLESNQDTVHKIKNALSDLSKGEKGKLQAIKNAIETEIETGDAFLNRKQNGDTGVYTFSQNKHVMKLSDNMCHIADGPSSSANVQMLSVYDQLPFNNQDGGSWKQGWEIKYDVNSFKRQPLKVFVVPHSHTDPGWIKTFENYYQQQTRHILNNMVIKLAEDRRRKFMYAEMSFFSRWWKDITEESKASVIKFIKNGQFELVTGGWVMPDEANTHYYAMIDQLIEGQHWLYNQLGVIPQSGWAIDPFGHSSTMAYILKRSGFKSMLIQRVHYEVKKYLARTKQLEFMWRQNWDATGSTDIFCHMMPFYSYDVPHTCGPDPKICCQFDFKRLPGGRITCPWRVPPVPITPQNVQQKSMTLLDQYRKKAQLYKNNIVLVILGDDFRYDTTIEWDRQFNNYQLLFDYMNNNKELNVQAQFGTLSDYFNAVYERGGVKPGLPPTGYPSLSGDFFTYTDREDHYWSGYYTSRPFYKNLDRVMESNLRSAEIMYSLSVSYARRHDLSPEALPISQLKKLLIEGRRGLSLFQHHDGITGTSKDAVVKDYGSRLLAGVIGLKNLMRTCVDFLAAPDKKNYKFTEHVFDLDEIRASHDALPVKTVINLSDKPRTVIFYNSLGHERTDVVRLRVNSPNVIVQDPTGKNTPSQVNLVWTSNEDSHSTEFELVFPAVVPALGFSRYTIMASEHTASSQHSSVVMYNAASTASINRGHFQIYRKQAEEFSIENSELVAQFTTQTGLLKTIMTKYNKQTVEVNCEFITYGTRNTKEKSGAYLFLPDGDAKSLSYSRPFTRVIRGPILTEVHVVLPYIEHVVRLYNTPGTERQALEIFNIVDISSTRNLEIAMRMKTSLQNGDTFYTDLNGFQILKRKTYQKIPMQGNFYPMPQLAYIEDSKTRLTLLTGQSLGVAALKPGWLEVMLDRRLNQDDNRGLQQGVLDNHRTPNSFRVLVEHRDPVKKVPVSQSMGYATPLSHMLSLQLIHPLTAFPSNKRGHDRTFRPQFSPVVVDMPCELHFLNLRTLQGKESENPVPLGHIAMLLHRVGFDCSYPTHMISCQAGNGKLPLKELFRDLSISKLQSTSLNLLQNDLDLDPSSTLDVAHMEIQAYKITFQ